MIRPFVLLLSVSLLAGCGSISFTVNKETVLAEPAFNTVALAGDVTAATRCVGRHVQQASRDPGYGVSVDSYQVVVSLHPAGSNRAPVPMIIEVDSASTGHARVHPIFKTGHLLRTIAIDAMRACRA